MRLLKIWKSFAFILEHNLQLFRLPAGDGSRQAQLFSTEKSQKHYVYYRTQHQSFIIAFQKWTEHYRTNMDVDIDDIKKLLL